MTLYYESELYHHGVKGMRWGVRRKYESFPGSYTKAGVQRFKDSDAKYQKAQSNYKAAKKNKAPRYEKQMAKAKVKQAKSDMKKDYAHLKYDKLGDEGKLRYAKGERITNNKRASNLMRATAGTAMLGASYLRSQNQISDKAYAYVVGGSLALAGASYVTEAIKRKPNNQLRAYYGHTSNYK